MPYRCFAYLAGFSLLAVLCIGCERTPEDVERWRNAERGTQKMTKWIRSSSEPMAVRSRSLEIQIEEGEASLLGSTLEKVDDKKARTELVAAGVETIQKMWKKQDFPKMKDGKKQGKFKVSESKAVKAKDAAYYLQPYATGKAKTALESILAEWLSDDWRLRNKLGAATLGQLLPRSGGKGLENALEWLRETKQPAKVVRILQKKTDDETKGKIAEIVLERAEKKHPDLSSSLRTAVLEVRHETIVPYLKKVVTSPNQVSPKFNDLARQALVEIQGERATPFLTKVIGNHGGNLRWAAINDLISLRGKAGILSAMSALPLEKKTYDYPDAEDKNFKKDASWFGNFVVAKMLETDVSALTNTLVKALRSERWPAQVLALACIQRAEACARSPEACGDESKKESLLSENRETLESAVDELTRSREKIPAWGGDYKTVGQLAGEVADQLSSS